MMAENRGLLYHIVQYFMHSVPHYMFSHVVSGPHYRFCHVVSWLHYTFCHVVSGSHYGLWQGCSWHGGQAFSWGARPGVWGGQRSARHKQDGFTPHAKACTQTSLLLRAPRTTSGLLRAPCQRAEVSLYAQQEQLQRDVSYYW